MLVLIKTKQVYILIFFSESTITPKEDVGCLYVGNSNIPVEPNPRAAFEQCAGGSFRITVIRDYDNQDAGQP